MQPEVRTAELGSHRAQWEDQEGGTGPKPTAARGDLGNKRPLTPPVSCPWQSSPRAAGGSLQCQDSRWPGLFWWCRKYFTIVTSVPEFIMTEEPTPHFSADIGVSFVSDVSCKSSGSSNSLYFII